MLKSAAIIALAVASALLAAQAVSVLDARSQAAVATAQQAEAQVNGKRVRFLVDTGATTVALTAADAKRLGMDPADLTFDRPVNTASGQVHAAMVELDYVSVAGARVEKVQALVLERGLTSSLLGMSYLGRLSKFEATPTALILRP